MRPRAKVESARNVVNIAGCPAPSVVAVPRGRSDTLRHTHGAPNHPRPRGGATLDAPMGRGSVARPTSTRARTMDAATHQKRASAMSIPPMKPIIGISGS